MGILDNAIKQIESKLSRYFLKYPKANFQKSLDKVLYAWNNTYVKKTDSYGIKSLSENFGSISEKT